MRFLMLNWRDPKNPRSGGAERVTQGYLAGLLARGHEAYWFTNHFPGAPATEDIEGIHIVRAGFKASSVFAAWRWYRRQPPFDLVIDQHHGIPWYAPWWCKTNCVAYVHEVLGPIWNVFYRWPASAIGRWQERGTHWLYRNVPFWTASESTKAALLGHGVEHVTLIPYGVATVALPELDPKPLTPPLRLVAVSRLAPNKRIDHVIRSHNCLLNRGLEVELTVIGAGESEPHLRQLASELGSEQKVRFTGLLSESEKDEQLCRAHFLLHTSLREGWGLNVIEANAMGTPAAVYPVAGLTEATLHDRTGLVAAQQTPEALADALEGCLRSPGAYARYRQAAWERAKTFHWSQVLPIACAWLEAQARKPGQMHANRGGG
jgi:glycosyltransferase involved in cell wall biosynthesis